MFLTAMSQKLAKHEHFSCRAVSSMIIMFVKLTNLYVCGKRRNQWYISNVFIKKRNGESWGRREVACAWELFFVVVILCLLRKQKWKGLR